MDKRQALRRIGVIADQLRGEPRNLVGNSQRNWHIQARINCVGKALLACVEKLERPARETHTFEGARDGADFYYKAAMCFLNKKPRRRKLP